MSRSYKKTPVIKDSSCKGTRFKSGKQLANRAVRNQEDVPNGGSYKKVYCSWNISDWHFMKTEQLYTDGGLVIHHKKGSRKYYDIAGKHIPEEILEAENPCKDEESFAAWRVLRRIGAVGLLWDKNSTACFSRRIGMR